MTLLDEMLGRLVSAVLVVDQDDIGLGAGGRPVHEDDGHVVVAVDLVEEGVVALVGDDDEPGDPAADQLAHGPALDLGVLVGGAQQDRVAGLVGDLDGGLGEEA